MNIAIYGIGNFGYAFLKHLDYKNNDSYTLTAYDHNPERVDYLTIHHKHPVLHPNTILSENITFTNNLEDLLKDADIILLATPSTATREAMQNIRKLTTKPFIVINTAKSLDTATGKRLSEIVSEELSGMTYSYALLAGGTIASDLFQHEPLGVDIACENLEALETLREVFESGNLHVYPTTDLRGVEYAAACKNVISILAGIVKGLGFSYGAETHVISKTAQHIANACIAHLGASPETFSVGSQCWGNDMWMSCTGNTRNREFGILVGSGWSVDDAIQRMAQENKLVEGINTLKAINDIEELRSIKPIKLLHELIIERSTDIQSVKNHILRID